MLAHTLRALLSHWQRRPWQAAALLLGLATATALWSGVQALNAEARQSYDRAAALLGADRFTTIAVAGNVPLPQADYIALRRAGWRVSPVLERTYIYENRPYRLIGIDPLTLPPGALGAGQIDGAADLSAFLAPPHRIFTDAETATALAEAGLPEVVETEGLPPGTLIADIGFVQTTLGQPGEITRLIAAPTQKPTRTPLENVTETRLIATPPADTPELAALTNSFHLNLTAFGLLSFTVGLFIVHATIGLAFEQRRPLFRTLRALGTPQRTLLTALGIELGLLALTAGAAGTALGYVIAASLLPDVAASLRGLYGAQVAGTLSLSPLWWLAGIAISLAGAAIAATTSFWKAATLPILAPVGTEAWLGAEHRAQRLQRILAAILLLAAALSLLGDSLLAGFTLMGTTLMAAALLLPSLLSLLITTLARTAKTPVAEWFWADTRAQLGGLSLALMALLLALSVNIGVGTMVDGFRQTFLAYLDKRLASELYIYAETDAQAAAIKETLDADPKVTATLPIWNAETRYEGWPVFVYGYQDHPTYRENWPLIDQGPTPWDATATGTATIISEQFARRYGLAPGDTITLPTPKDDWRLEVAAIYADYGNPTG
ncbi:MAG: ABC transporter permease, partial [Pseudomonadota bacterium]